MKPGQIYQELKVLAEKLDVTVSEQNLRSTGVKARSGLCKVKGNYLFIIDRNKSIHRKIRILATELAKMPHEDVYIVPAVRELLVKYAPEPLPQDSAAPAFEPAKTTADEAEADTKKVQK